LAQSKQAAEAGYNRRRRFPRFRFDVRIRLSVFREGVTTLLWGRSSELGADGIDATLSGELTVGEVVGMEFPLPVAPHVMKVRAIVRYSQGLRCGFEFLVVTSEQRDMMSRTCEVLANS
jgi:hypothetical protein